MGLVEIGGCYTANKEMLSGITLKTDIFRVKKVIFNNPATVVLWEDGTKTVVICQHGDEYDRKTGLLLCFAKKLFGNTGKFNDIIREWVVR